VLSLPLTECGQRSPYSPSNKVFTLSWKAGLVSLSVALGWLAHGATGEATRSNSGVTGSPAVTAPTPRLSPQQVVAIQLQALRHSASPGKGIEVCYRFASPANKASTGPLPRFTEMIETGAYSLMLNYRQAAYETMEVLGAAARQRVTLYGDGQATVFTFYLSRQEDAACPNCWMTEAVTAQPAGGIPI